MSEKDPVFEFLLGSGPLDGVWFGDRHPTEKGAFWWRQHLRSALLTQAERSREQVIEECAKVCEQKLLVFDGCGDVKIGVEMAGKLLVNALRALKHTQEGRDG